MYHRGYRAWTLRRARRASSVAVGSSMMLIQQITPEVLQWVSAQAQAGHLPDAVLQAMRASGWHDEVARSAIEQSKRGSLVEPPPPVAVPAPDLADSPWTVHTSDREVRVLAS